MKRSLLRGLDGSGLVCECWRKERETRWIGLTASNATAPMEQGFRTDAPLLSHAFPS